MKNVGLLNSPKQEDSTTSLVVISGKDDPEREIWVSLFILCWLSLNTCTHGIRVPGHNPLQKGGLQVKEANA